MFYFITLLFANFFGWMDCDDAFVLTMAGANMSPLIITNHNKSIDFIRSVEGHPLFRVL